MAKKKGGIGRVVKAGGAAAGVSAESAPAREFNEGDLVLAKVKGWPAWPAQIERLETEGKFIGKYYVTFFGPGQQIGWCTPAELSYFDADQKEASIQKSMKNADKKFLCAVKEICAVQDERAGVTRKDSADESGDLLEDGASRDSGLDGQEDDTAKKGDAISDVKHDDTYLTQVVTLNQQDDSVPFHDGNPEEGVEDDAEKDWSEKPEYNGSDLQTGRDSDGRGQKEEASPDGVLEEGFMSFAEDQEADSEANAGTKRALKNALKKINETAEKDSELKTKLPDSEGQFLTYQYGRKKNRNKNNSNTTEPPVADEAGTIASQKAVQDLAPLHAETSEVQKKMKSKVGRPAKASQKGNLGGRDSKSNSHATLKPNAGEKDLNSGKGIEGSNHEGSGKLAKDPTKNGHVKKGPYSKKKDTFSSSVKEGVLAGVIRERNFEDKKDVKGVSSEADRFKKGPKKSQISSKGSEEGKKHSAASKQRDDHVKSSLNGFEKRVTASPSSLLGGSKGKAHIRGEGSLKRTRLPDGEGEGKEEDTSLKREKGDAGTSPKIDVDEKRLPLSKKPRMLASENKLSEGKQKHESIGRSGLDRGNVKKGSPRDGKSRERGTSLPPKADKDRMRKAALDGEAALPPSKRRNRAFAAMSAWEAEAATVSPAESREQREDGVTSHQAGTNVTAAASSETLRKEGTAVCGSQAVAKLSPLKNAFFTPDMSESTDGGHKSLKVGGGHDNVGGQERIESRKHLLLTDPQATDSPSGSEDPRELKRGSKRGPHGKSYTEGLVTKGIASPVHTKPSLEAVTEKRKGHLAGSESGKLSTASLGGSEVFPSIAKPVFEDSIIKNAVALANEKRNALKREGDSSASMKVLIAAAQAKQRARQYSTGGSGSFGFAEFDKLTNSVVCSPSPSQRRGSSRLTSPNQHGQVVVMDLHDRHGGWNSSVDERSGVLSGEPIIDTEATIARDTFVGMLETVSRTKDSIGRTTRQAMDCGKHGIAEQIIEIIVRKLENEPSFHRRVDYWFLLDSVTQVAHTQKVVAYLPIVQSSLPRILNAAAPPGGVARENRKQCLKVLNLWLERKVMSEPILRHFMTEIESHNDDKGLPGGGHRRLSRYERGVDDPVRDMDGMLVDEYGSNASLNLPDGFSIIPQLYEDDEDGSEDDDKKLETLSLSAINTTGSTDAVDSSEKFRTVLEDVDGELEMEDVSPTADSELLAMKERERLLGDHFTEARSNPTQPPLPLDPPPSIPSPPPLPADPPPSPPPPPRSPPPPLTTSQSPCPKAGIAIMQNSSHSQDTSNDQQSDSPSMSSAYSSHQGQGNLGLPQGVSKSNSCPAGSMSQLPMPLGSPLPPPPSQNSSPGFAQGAPTAIRLPPPPPLPLAFRPQRVWPESLASPARDSDVSPQLARPREEQVRQGLQEVSGGERVGGALPSAQPDARPAHSGGCPSEGAKPGDQASAGAMSGYASNATICLNQDQEYRINSGVRPVPGAQLQYGRAGMQHPMRGRPYSGQFSPRAQHQGPAMNPPGSQGPMQMLAFRSGGSSHSSWRPA